MITPTKTCPNCGAARPCFSQSLGSHFAFGSAHGSGQAPILRLQANSIRPPLRM